ncbi:MAG: HAMP domain-containing histidine kinase [Saprospiraceae bacterium]|nr:HAMP domain-containing histidine kinase [Saprospiraceae bacterium]
MVTNLLVAARLDNSYSYNFEKCDLLEITNRVIKSLNIESNNDEIEIKSYKPNPMVYGDRESLISVFTNLIENSIKYSSSPAKIKVSIIEKKLICGN